jgi:hypothetical protein
MEDLILDGENTYLFETQIKTKRRKTKGQHNHEKHGLSLFKIDC